MQKVHWQQPATVARLLAQWSSAVVCCPGQLAMRWQLLQLQMAQHVVLAPAAAVSAVLPGQVAAVQFEWPPAFLATAGWSASTGCWPRMASQAVGHHQIPGKLKMFITWDSFWHPSVNSDSHYLISKALKSLVTQALINSFNHYEDLYSALSRLLTTQEWSWHQNGWKGQFWGGYNKSQE